MRERIERGRLALFAGLFVFLLATRCCHLRILWAEESYPAAAALQLLCGKTLYRDFWFDKPPLAPLVYLLWGAYPGWPLRLAGACFALLACWLIWRFASGLWSEREGRVAACLLAFFLTFDIPSSVTTLAPDLLMLAPHAAALYCAWRRRPFLSGALAGVAMLVNAKGVFVIAACALWTGAAWPALLSGFVAVNAAALAWLWMAGALPGYWEQVWRWGWLYSRDTFAAHPMREGFLRTIHWMGFHAALALGAAWFWWRERSPDSRRLAAWAVISLAAVAAGWRFFPRYYFQLLPVMVLAGARGWTLLGRARIVLLLALAIPLARFGPRYATLARDALAGRETQWPDIALNQDSRRAAAMVRAHARPGDTLLVWGYRPDLFVYTRMPAGTRFLDSQPLTGVIADRHLIDSRASAPALAAANRRQLIATRPAFVVDGLGPMNPRLAIPNYADLGPWLAAYREIGRTGACVIYRYDGVATGPSSRAPASPGTP